MDALSDDALFSIVERLPIDARSRLARCSKRLHSIADAEASWSNLHASAYGPPEKRLRRWRDRVRCAKAQASRPPEPLAVQLEMLKPRFARSMLAVPAERTSRALRAVDSLGRITVELDMPAASDIAALVPPGASAMARLSALRRDAWDARSVRAAFRATVGIADDGGIERRSSVVLRMRAFPTYTNYEGVDAIEWLIEPKSAKLRPGWLELGPGAFETLRVAWIFRAPGERSVVHQLLEEDPGDGPNVRPDLHQVCEEADRALSEALGLGQAETADELLISYCSGIHYVSFVVGSEGEALAQYR